MKIYENYYFQFGWKVSAAWLATSFFLHVIIILICYNFIVYPGNELLSEAKRNLSIGISYIIPGIIYAAGWKLSWHLYEEHQEYEQYKWYTIFLFLSIAAIFSIDKFILNII